MCLLPQVKSASITIYPLIRSSASTTSPPTSNHNTIVWAHDFFSLFFSIPPPSSNCPLQHLSACSLHLIAESLYSFCKGSFARLNLKQYRVKAKQEIIQDIRKATLKVIHAHHCMYGSQSVIILLRLFSSHSLNQFS